MAYDEQGLVFAASTSLGKANVIKLYDARNVSAGPGVRRDKARFGRHTGRGEVEGRGEEGRGEMAKIVGVPS